MPYPFLPQLHGARVGDPGAIGKWTEVPDLLKAASEDMVSDTNATADVVTSIPTPWARPQVFADALANIGGGHPLREEVKNEWRGLLALFCFQKRLGLSLTAERLKISDPDAADAQVAKSLVEVAPIPPDADKAVKPAEAKDAWKTVYLIKAGDRLIAATSPLSLFYTPNSYRVAAPWKNKQTGRLTDPFAYYEEIGISNCLDDIATLHAWLKQFKASLSRLDLPGEPKPAKASSGTGTAQVEHHPYRNALNEQVDAWIEELDYELQKHTKAPDIGALEYEYVDGIEEPYRSYCASAKSTVINTKLHLVTGQCKTMAEDGRGVPVMVCQQIQEKRPNLLIDGTNTIGTIRIPDEAEGDTLRTKSGIEIKRKWVNPERLFFTEKVLELALSDAMLGGGLEGTERQCVLPLTRQALDFFRPLELADRFRWRKQGTDWVAELDLPLGQVVAKEGEPTEKETADEPDTTPEDKRKHRQVETEKFTISRVYPAAAVVRVPKEEKQPVIAFWPNFWAEDWQYNYIYLWGNPRVPDLKIRPVDHVEHAERLAEPWDGEVWRTERLTCGLECTWHEGEQDVPVGLIVPEMRRLKTKFPECRKPATATRVWQVAVDFGTSNTTIATLDPTVGVPSEWRVKDRLVFASRFPHDAQRFEAVNIHIKPSFQPAQARTEPPVRETGIATSTCAVYSPDGYLPVTHASFLPMDCLPNFSYYLLVGEGANIRSGLKWSTDATSRQLIATLLKHMVMLVAAEAKTVGVTDMTISWSYPSALPQWMVNDLEGKWTALHLTFTGTGIALDIGAKTTESEAVCRYVHHARSASIAGNALATVDIGGGTTDVAIWQNGKLHIQDSAYLAAGVVPEYLSRHLDAFKELVVEVAEYARAETWPQWEAMWRRSNKYSLISAAVNVILRDAGKYPNTVSNILYRQSDSKSHVPKLRDIIFLTLGGYAYYVGLCLRKIHKGQPGTMGCEIWLAGNGAGMLDWVSGAQKNVRDALCEIVRGAADLGANLGYVTMERTDRLKQEAARGLLYPALATLEDRNKAKRFLFESNYRYDTVELGWDTDLTQERYHDDSLHPPAELDELKRFLELYDQHGGQFHVTKLVPLVDHQKISDAVRTRIVSHHRQVQAGQEREQLASMFLEEVRAIMDKYLLGQDGQAATVDTHA
jgi:hypothetical protein